MSQKGVVMEISSDFKVQFSADDEEVKFLWNGIYQFNETIGPMLKYPPYEPYRIIVRDQNNNIIGGILTKIYLKCILIELFWIDIKYRRHNIGSELLKDIERHAKELGCTFVHLDTFSFQAIEFYKKFGYEVFAVLDDYPEESIKRYFLKKYL
jgi:GNAT superfamily N-acetyltransferase